MMGIQPNIIKDMLRAIYSDQAPEFREECTMALLAVANMLDLAGLKKKCETVLCSNLNVDNIIDALLTAERHRCINLMARPKPIFGSHLSVFKKQEKWQKPDVEKPIRSCSSFWGTTVMKKFSYSRITACE